MRTSASRRLKRSRRRTSRLLNVFIYLVLFRLTDVREALRLLRRVAELHRAAQHRADVARVASIKIGRAAGGHALAVGVARARRRRGFLIGGEHGRRRGRVERVRFVDDLRAAVLVVLARF